MLEQIKHIEGLESYEDVEMFDDTPPGAIQTKFWLKAEDQPFLSEKEGRRITKNIVVVSRTWHLGMTSYTRPINDEVIYDEVSQKWKVLKLAPIDRSDIRKNPDEWNAFVRGSTGEDIGTPLSLLFRTDPSLVEHYKGMHINTIEQLAAQEANIINMGAGAIGHVKKAQKYISEAKEHAPIIEMNYKLEEKDRQINSLQTQLMELNVKLQELLNSKLDSAPKRGPGRKNSTQIEDNSQSLQGNV